MLTSGSMTPTVSSNGTARVHQHASWRCGHLAVRGARAAPERMRRIGVLMGTSVDQEGGDSAAFPRGLQELGWTDGHNVRIDNRWGADSPDTIRKYAAELVALAPDVILTSGTATIAALLHATRTVPIDLNWALFARGLKCSSEQL